MLVFLRRLLATNRGGSLGRAGERLAERHLKQLGMRVLARNYVCKLGEIDLIARDAETLVFVEVKTRRSGERVEPEAQVHPRKQQQIARVARYYLKRFKDAPPGCRFDVVAIVWPDDATDPEVRHIPGAFRV